MQNELGCPDGAIWIRGMRFRERIVKVFRKYSVELREEDIKYIFDACHTLAIKINVQKEKYIAIPNNKKNKPRQPDYYIHLYQTHTGAAPLPPWNVAVGVGYGRGCGFQENGAQNLNQESEWQESIAHTVQGTRLAQDGDGKV